MPITASTFLNLPVRDVARSRAFFERLGFAFNEKFCDESAACLVFNEGSYAMLLDRDRFADFAGRPVPEPQEVTAGLYCFSAESREEVDAITSKALAAGASPAKEPTDYGFMYGTSFYDPDGHHWEVTWMDPKAVELGPEAFVASQQA